MIRYVDGVSQLAEEIRDLMSNYEYREAPLLHYIASVLRESVPIDYFTTLLRKKGRVGQAGSSRFEEEMDKMAEYALRKIRGLQADGTRSLL